ncbi:Uncharacterised protein [BD1-7 clade bacterium]|uniref:EamA domain-containing protein n=1 Tax=BD1-7 clade bacterium TaxID=2029982 RepID=A0A5S9NP74_9GAMM|nr:Uncharacterised protein [BD1-7 clade bacterium]
MYTERQGLTYTFAYIAILSLSSVFVEKLSLHVSIEMMNLCVAVMAALTFNAMNISRLGVAYRAVRSQPRLWLWMSVSIAGSWILSYYCTMTSSADFSMALVFLSCSLIGAIFNKNMLKVLFCLLSIGLCFDAARQSLLSTTYGIASGVCLFFYTYYSKQYAAKNQATSLDILSVRFFPMMIVAAALFIMYNNPKTGILTASSSLHIWGLIILVCFANRVIPMLFFQPAVQALKPDRLSFLLTLVPLTTYLFESAINRHFPVDLFLAVGISTLALNIDRIWVSAKSAYHF